MTRTSSNRAISARIFVDTDDEQLKVITSWRKEWSRRVFCIAACCYNVKPCELATGAFQSHFRYWPMTRCHDYISYLACSSLGLEPEELHVKHLWLLQSTKGKTVFERMNATTINKQRCKQVFFYSSRLKRSWCWLRCEANVETNSRNITTHIINSWWVTFFCSSAEYKEKTTIGPT